MSLQTTEEHSVQTDSESQAGSSDLASVGDWLRSLPVGQQTRFSDALQTLMKEGLLWRDDGGDTPTYAYLVRNLSHARAYFHPLGLSLLHHERLHILQLKSNHPGLRRTFNKETTLWALLCRLIYAEKKESSNLALTQNPVVLAGDLYMRYAELFPGRNLRKKAATQEALAALAGAKMIRPHQPLLGHALDPDVLIELLPALEVLMPAAHMKDISDRIAAVAPLKREPGDA